jgi:SAM-dependent methyltransferase
MATVKSASAVGFDKEAESYNRFRPSYPSAAINIIGSTPGLGLPLRSVVGDMAAGTGIASRQLLAAGHRVVAIEPVLGMRRQLAASTAVPIVASTAEHIALRDGSLDAMVGYQAFHWFDLSAALSEMARVIRPGGGIVMVWNARDESCDWVHQWTHIVHSMSDGQPYHDHRSQPWAELVAEIVAFKPLQHMRIDHPLTTTPTAVIERTRNTSFVAALPPQRQEPLLNAVRELLDTHRDVAGRDEFVLPNYTEIYWATRR